jgi:hypothetical protein
MIGISSESGLGNAGDAVMLRVLNDGRLFGLDFGDWSILFAGFALSGISTLFF